MKQPLRILNEPPAFFGLSIFDLAVVGWILVLSHALLEKAKMGYLALIIAVVASLILIAIRMRYRRKIIRDTLRLILTGKIR